MVEFGTAHTNNQQKWKNTKNVENPQKTQNHATHPRGNWIMISTCSWPNLGISPRPLSVFYKGLFQQRVGRNLQFAGGLFQEVLKGHSIKFEPSPPYTPEFNGVTEHFNRDIVSMVKSMLAGANMSTGFWAEALQYAVCILSAAPA